MLPLGFPSLWFSPIRYKPHGVGNWSGHIPFARDLIEILRPAVFVELGTHLGESYFAFCQAIVESGTAAKAYAVDTWFGDIHTGSYGEEVWAEVEAHNRQHYDAFSELMRMRFDEAAERFHDQSIDLLHIDGMHTYEAVRHDFDTWWPKIKAGGVVLLHDSFVRTGDFGVWKLVEETREQSLPVAEFFHSNGLGIVVKPGERPGGVISPLMADDPGTQAAVRRYYEVCADHLEQNFFSERQKRPAEWDVTTQLFWRSDGEAFTETASGRVSHTVTSAPARIAMQLPAQAKPLVELRVDLSDVPACLKLHEISAVAAGERLWTIHAAESARELSDGGLHGVVAADSSGVLVVDTPTGGSFLAPIGAAALEPLASGGEITIELSSLDPMTFASQLAIAGAEGISRSRLDEAAQPTRQREAEFETLSWALEQAQRLALERLEKLGEFDRALGEAQRLSLDRMAELERYDRALGEAQQIAAAKQVQLDARRGELFEAKKLAASLGADLDSAKQALRRAEQRLSELETERQLYRLELADARQEIAKREEESGRIRQRLGAIENSGLWRALRRFMGVRR